MTIRIPGKRLNQRQTDLHPARGRAAARTLAAETVKDNQSILSLLAAILVMAIAVVVLASRPANAFEVQEVISPGGVKALLVEDYTVPIISLRFSMKGGTSQDPASKAGAVRLMVSMLDEGAGDLDNIQFQSRAEDLGAELGFSANRDSITGGLRTLKSEADASFELLRLALNQPRFDDKPLERIRASIKEGIVRSQFRPQTLAGKALRESMFANHPYAREGRGTVETLDAISRQDMVDLHNKLISSGELHIGVVGAISAEELAITLDVVFGNLPKQPDLNEISYAELQLGETRNVELNTPQTSISLVYPGLKRDNPEFFAAHLAAHVLGGGTFNSRLYDAVREKRGLAYSIYAQMVTQDHAAYTMIGSSTRADQSAQALEIILEEVQKIALKGPTSEELDAAKKYVTGAYAINNLDSSGGIAASLVAIQRENLGDDYIEKRAAIIDAVTLEDVKQVARKLLSGKPTIVTVGPGSG